MLLNSIKFSSHVEELVAVKMETKSGVSLVARTAKVCVLLFVHPF